MTSRRQTYRWTSEDITLCSSLGGSRVVAREPIGANATDVDAFDRSGAAFDGDGSVCVDLSDGVRTMSSGIHFLGLEVQDQHGIADGVVFVAAAGIFTCGLPIN